MTRREPSAEYVFFPRWLPLHQRETVRARALAAFARFEAERGARALLDRRVRRRIIGGLAAAFKCDRVGNPAWGRRMLGKRGGKARARSAATVGEQVRHYFAELGRRGRSRQALGGDDGRRGSL